MKSSNEYIESGILEEYVLGMLSSKECNEVEEMAALHPAIRTELDLIAAQLEKHAMDNAIVPGPVVKSFVMAGIDYMERKANGELTSIPPLLHKQSTLEEFAEWLNNKQWTFDESEPVKATLISYTPKVTTAIVWVKDYTPAELHSSEYEHFLIAEGTCDITIGDEVHQLAPGDYLAIPLHNTHFVKVTSARPCKIILQRVAA